MQVTFNLCQIQSSLSAGATHVQAISRIFPMNTVAKNRTKVYSVMPFSGTKRLIGPRVLWIFFTIGLSCNQVKTAITHVSVLECLYQSSNTISDSYLAFIMVFSQ